ISRHGATAPTAAAGLRARRARTLSARARHRYLRSRNREPAPFLARGRALPARRGRFPRAPAERRRARRRGAAPAERQARRRDRPGPLPFRGAHRSRGRSEEHTSELQSRENLVCRLLLEKKKKKQHKTHLTHTTKNN